MSLAILCQKLIPHLKGKIQAPRLDYRAFIVDHKARDGSTEEAELVSERLRTMGRCLHSWLYGPLAKAEEVWTQLS